MSTETQAPLSDRDLDLLAEKIAVALEQRNAKPAPDDLRERALRILREQQGAR
jgi:hypothetical protein